MGQGQITPIRAKFWSAQEAFITFIISYKCQKNLFLMILYFDFIIIQACL